jgi:hypothetical protein
MNEDKKMLENYIVESTRNIENDRALASKLLIELMELMEKQKDDKYTHKNYGEIAAMYLESLQRSNEQLVKLASIVQKQEGGKDGMSKTERDDLFDLIKEG